MTEQQIVDTSHVEVRDEALDRTSTPEEHVTGTDIPVDNTLLAEEPMCCCMSMTLVHSCIEIMIAIPSTIA